MSTYVLGFADIDPSQIALVGGKGAGLGALCRIDGVHVPAGFCVTTAAFRRVMAGASSIDDQLDRLSRLDHDDREKIRTLSEEIRATIERLAIPDDLTAAITGALAGLGERTACAVRSSATAEDLPTTSFAGQQDTYLNVIGASAILEHISRCWASLFTDRAVSYRARNGIDHREVDMAVVVQQMVFPDASGTVFTADPITSNRKIVSVDASFGLGEAVVSGLVNPDVYTVRDREIVTTSIATKQLGVYASPPGGTRQQTIEPARQNQQVLTDAQIVRLAALARRIEAHFGCPQDIEWCVTGDDFDIVQSRPITTLFPIPVSGDGENHVYVSVGHQQMMTDAMKPLGLSVWLLTAGRPMDVAGGRLFVDVTAALASPASRTVLVEGLGRSDPLIRDALQTLLDRGDFVPSLPDGTPGGPPIPGTTPSTIETDPGIVAELITQNEDSLAALQRDIRTKSGVALVDLVLADLQELKRILFQPRNMQAIMAGFEATWWLNDQLQAWLGDKNMADTLTQSVPGNVTSEMGLALLDVADVIRPHPDVVAFLRSTDDDGFLDALDGLDGGADAADAIRGFLGKYGMRCVGEIDITRPRWSEHPTTLIPAIIDNVRNFEPGAAARRFQRGLQEASAKEAEVLERVRSLPDGEHKAGETKRMIDRVRTFAGYREYPKYAIVRRYYVYKQALLAEAERLAQEGVIRAPDDIFFLTLQELHDVVRTNHADEQLILERRQEFESSRGLKPPRVLTSDGETLAGAYRRDDVPAGALVGLPVSTGIVEGRARVMTDIAQADLEPGDILVTPYTDPSWTPLFVSIAGLVTEVGGLMTHGAVIAREYGLPAVVGIENATRLIRDGQRIRVHGSDGYVELCP